MAERRNKQPRTRGPAAARRVHDPEGDVIALSFATRQLLMDLDRDHILERAVESLSDFGRTERLGLYLLEDDGETLLGYGGPAKKEPRETGVKAPLAGSAFEDVINERNPAVYELSNLRDLPWPVKGGGVPGRTCLCAPMIGANNKVIGVAVFEHEAGFALEPILMQSLVVLLTVTAIALETSRLFEHAVYDGLTGLYVRRYLDLRLREEINRLKRYGGRLALLIIDIDHFKRVNDRYGHQQGDVVLREIARMVMGSVRLNLDAVCRYGGEEFVVIMPDTDLIGATVVAERIRSLCEAHAFEGPGDETLHVTLSGGVAHMDQAHIVEADELLRRADACLYRAKESGRNRVCTQGPND